MSINNIKVLNHAMIAYWRHLANAIEHDSLGPCELTTQTASRSVQPFLHR